MIANVYAGFNRHRLPATTTDCVGIDHRSLVSAEGDLPASIPGAMTGPDAGHEGSAWSLCIPVEAILRNRRNPPARSVTPEGFDAQWRMIFLYIVKTIYSTAGGLRETRISTPRSQVQYCNYRTRRLETRQSQWASDIRRASRRDWVAMAELLADDIVADDRRRIVNAGVRQGRMCVADSRTAAGLESHVQLHRDRKAPRLARIHSFNRGFRADEEAPR